MAEAPASSIADLQGVCRAGEQFRPFGNWLSRMKCVALVRHPPPLTVGVLVFPGTLNYQFRMLAAEGLRNVASPADRIRRIEDIRQFFSRHLIPLNRDLIRIPQGRVVIEAA